MSALMKLLRDVFPENLMLISDKFLLGLMKIVQNENEESNK